MLGTFWQLLRDTVSAWRADFAPSMGAALSYYTLFSLAPLLIIAIAVAGLVFGPEAVRGEIFAQLQGLLGDEGATAVEDILKSASTPKSGMLATVVGVGLLVFGATSVFAELQADLDRIWKVPLREATGIWTLLRDRLLSFGMVLGVGFLLLVSLIVSAALSAFARWSQGWLAELETMMQAVNFLVSFALITGLFAMIYKILPRAAIAWQDVWIGSVFTALLFSIGKFAIGFYIGRSHLSAAYGAAGSLVVVLVWVYYAAQIFLLGAEFTCVYAKTRGSHATESALGPLALGGPRS
jgi:membrane protein